MVAWMVVCEKAFLSKEENIELGFEQSGELPILDRLSIETKQMLTKRFQIVFWNF